MVVQTSARKRVSSRLSAQKNEAAPDGEEPPTTDSTGSSEQNGTAGKLDARIIIRFLVVHLVTLGLATLVVRTFDFGLVAATSFAVNWVAGIHSILNGMTEKYYDFTGMLCYMSCITISAYAAFETQGQLHIRQWVNSALVILWTGRLGTFLFARILRDLKEEKRNPNIFDDLREHPLRFMGAWTVQGLWVLLVALPVFVLNTIPDQPPLKLQDVIGWGMWTVGFLCEAFADSQKAAFRKNPENKGRYITTGLWSWSQHPNYFGEILLWCGMVVTCASASNCWAHALTLLSPLFTAFLLLKVTGIPQMQKAGDERWGHEAGYQTYRKETSLLVPVPPKKTK